MKRLLLAVVMFVLMAAPMGAQPKALFSPLPSTAAFAEARQADLDDVLAEAGIRARLVTVDASALPARDAPVQWMAQSLGSATEVQLNFVPKSEIDKLLLRQGVKPPKKGFVVTAVLSEVEQPAADSVTWLGSVKDDRGSTVSITLHRDVVYVTLRSVRYGVFEAAPLPSNPAVTVVREVDDGRIPECGTGLPPPPGTPGPETRQQQVTPSAQLALPADDRSRINVMGLYTPLARRRAGSQSAIEGLIRNSVARGNLSLRNSRITTQFYLVHMEEVTGYVEEPGTNGFYVMLDDLVYVDGELDNVHALRNTYRADLVFLIVNNSSIGGLGNVMSTPSASFAPSAYSVTSRTYALSQISAAHEMGHNMGNCHHPDDNRCNGAYSYSYGHRFTGNSGNRYRTVMAYRPGTRIEQFSNPNVSFEGRATGISNARDNARSMNNTASIVANFRRGNP